MSNNVLRESEKTNELKIDGIDHIIEFPVGKDIVILQIADVQGMLYSGIRKNYLNENGETYELLNRFIQVDNAFYSKGPKDEYVRSWQYIAEGVKKTNPDVIVLTGDNIYGETDDNGIMWQEMCDFLDTFGIPWLCLYGNHDNESQMGVHWQSATVNRSKFGFIKEGDLENGNCNYTVGIKQGGEIKYVLYALDTNGCNEKPYNFGESLLPYNPDIADIQQHIGIYPDQIEWIKDCSRKIEEYKADVPKLMFFHVPPTETYKAVSEKYKGACDVFPFYPNMEGDMGVALERICGFDTNGQLFDAAKEVNCKGMFVGHQHEVAVSVMYEGMRLTYGLKTGVSDYHDRNLIGTTKITIREADNSFDVEYVFSDIEYPME